MNGQWRIIDYQVHDAYENMAIDEALFVSVQKGGPSTLRFYGWSPASISLGYFQDYQREINDTACSRSGVDIVRRPTGGKAVFHGQDVTYCVVSNPDNPLFPPGVLGSYLRVSEWIRQALLELGIRAELSERKSRLSRDDAFCFAEPSRHEILVEGRKICGSAQMRSRGAFLQHGSLLLDFDAGFVNRLIPPSRPEDEIKLQTSTTSLKQALGIEWSPILISDILKRNFEAMLGIKLDAGELDKDERCLRQRLREEKYSSDLWNKSASISLDSSFHAQALTPLEKKIA